MIYYWILKENHLGNYPSYTMFHIWKYWWIQLFNSVWLICTKECNRLMVVLWQMKLFKARLRSYRSLRKGYAWSWQTERYQDSRYKQDGRLSKFMQITLMTQLSTNTSQNTHKQQHKKNRSKSETTSMNWWAYALKTYRVDWETAWRTDKT